MNILFFLPVWEPAWQYGGPIQSTYSLCKALQQYQHVNIRVITTSFGLPDWPKSSCNHEILRSEIFVTYFEAKNGRLFGIQSPTLLSSLTSYLEWADILHISAIWHPISIQIQRRAEIENLPVVHSIRGALSRYSFSTSPFKKSLYYFLFERPYLLKTSAIHLTSASECQDSFRSFLQLPNKLRRIVIPNIVMHTPFNLADFDRGQFLKVYDLSREVPTFLICGRVDSKKGLELIPKALSLINDKSWQLIIVGADSDGSLEPFLESLTPFSQHHSIRYLGLKTPADLQIIYSLSDLLLMPSLHENFGNVALESLNHGCRVLLSHDVGMANYLSQLPATNSWGAALPYEPTLWGSWIRQWLSCYQKSNRYSPDALFMNIFAEQQIAQQWVGEYSLLLQ
tara:strand:- start:6860 stop:8050 length:1191 start_codon:yes stop_codon:yes gene_type:complete